MTVVFTDLDGTLLDPATYGFEPARPALDLLERTGIPVVFVTSKTHSETEYFRGLMDNCHPFIVENGGAAFVPRRYFPFTVPRASTMGPYEVLEWGLPYPDLAVALDRASALASCPVRGFHHMDATEIAQHCGLPPDLAALAKERDYDEPFLILDPLRERPLLDAIENLGLRWTRGGRFFHILGENDKARAVGALEGLFAKAHGGVTTIGLGDAMNDVPFLRMVTHPVLVRSATSGETKPLLPHVFATARPGPEGWNEAIMTLIQE